MSAVMSQQLPKESEGEEEEEQGEEFEFEDSTDDEKLQEATKGISSLHLMENKGNETQTVTDGTLLLRTLPPDVQEATPTADSIPTGGKAHFQQ